MPPATGPGVGHLHAGQANKRLVELYVTHVGNPRKRSLGSGYLLGNGLVLTARHVVAPAEWGSVGWHSLVAEARALASGESPEFEKVKPVWPRDLVVQAGQRAPDIVLLRLPFAPPGWEEKVPVGPMEDGRATYEVYAGGFPAHRSEDAGPGLRETRGLRGFVHPFDGVRSGLYEITTSGPDGMRDPDPGLDWTGISGAALFNGQKIVGVVVTEAKGKPYNFRAVRLDQVLGNWPEFYDALADGAEINMPEASRMSQPPPVTARVCLLGRDAVAQSVDGGQPRVPLQPGEEEFNLGTGEERDGDVKKAARLYRVAVSKGHPGAQNRLAMLYEQGLDGLLPRDEKKAEQLYRRAAEAGYPAAQYNLGVFYEQGLGGLDPDACEAARLYRLAADWDHAAAQAALGTFYEKGRGGLPPSDQAAVRLYRSAADRDHAEAQYKLGTFYEQGRGGVEKDITEAVAWYQRAARASHRNAEQRLKVLEKLTASISEKGK